MAFVDWLTFNNGFNGSGGYPPLGTTNSFFGGSTALVMSGEVGHGVDAGGQTASANAVPDTLSKGFTSGRIRTLINPVVSGPANHGLICMMSANNMQEGMGSKGYAVMLDSIFSDNKAVLVRMNDGISISLGGIPSSSYSLLGQSSNSLWTQNTVYGLEIEWHVNSLIPGIHLIGRFGTMDDFSDLTIFAEAFDASAHSQLTTVGEGPYANLSTNSLIVAFDQTQLFSMTP